jgi:hypothetical protein
LVKLRRCISVSQLRRNVTEYSVVVLLDDITLDECLNYVGRLIVVLDGKTKMLRNREVHLDKVQWEHRRGSEWTWEPENEMRAQSPELFSSVISGTKSR